MTGHSTAVAATGSNDRGGAFVHNAAVGLLHEAYNRWSESKGIDAECWQPLLADDVRFGSLAAGAAHLANMNGSGREAVQSFFEQIAKFWSLLSFNIDEFIASGDSVVVRGRVVWQNKRTGKVFSSVKMDYWRFRDGKAVEFFEACDTAGIRAAASG
jgi:ketosteroid isomerase-like protein